MNCQPAQERVSLLFQIADKAQYTQTDICTSLRFSHSGLYKSLDGYYKHTSTGPNDVKCYLSFSADTFQIFGAFKSNQKDSNFELNAYEFH